MTSPPPDRLGVKCRETLHYCCNKFVADECASVARQNNNPQVCILKYWSNPGCTGTAVTWFLGTTKNVQCFPNGQNGGVQKLPNGAKSVIATCAIDGVPGSID